MKKERFPLIAMFVSLVFLLAVGFAQESTVDLKQLAMKIEKVYNTQDAAAVAQLYAEDAVYIVSGEAEPLRGRKAIEENYAAFFRAFPDLTVKFTTIITAKDQFSAEWIVKGTHTGPLATPEGDVPATGKTVVFKGAFFAKVNAEGFVTEDRTYYDTADFVSQLGLNEPPKKMSGK